MTSFGLLIVSQTELMTIGRIIIMETAMVQNKEDGNTIQPINRNSVSAIGTKLRLMLSNIFQRDNAESGFLCQCLLASGTTGKNLENICQSPRTQRENLFISAR